MDALLSDLDLLAQYTAAFERLDDLCAFEVPEPLRVSTEEDGWHRWRPLRFTTAPAALQALYRGLGIPGHGATRFPPLYETLVLSYRWAEVELGDYRLLANEPADDLSPLLASLRVDENLAATLVPNGYFPFGKGPDTDYDPVCFDFRHRQRNGDCRIVKVAHEEILCNYHIREIAELAPNFRSLVLSTIKRANSLPGSG